MDMIPVAVLVYSKYLGEYSNLNSLDTADIGTVLT